MKRQRNNILLYYAICFVLLLLHQSVSGQYEGGKGSGFYEADTSSNCSLINIYSGSGSDGFDFVKDILECDPPLLFSLGGSGSGFYTDSLLNNCPLSIIYKGDAADGFGYAINSPCPLDTVIIETELLQDYSCSTADLAIVSVQIVADNEFYSSSPDYTYIWKDENGDTLAGYPVTKSSLYDTLSNLEPGEYTIFVYDSENKVDSVTINIADCLYRGGSGVGFAFDTIQSDCRLTSVYKNSGNDGVDFGVDTSSMCDIYMFSSGGSGQGFDIDTLMQICNDRNIYSGDEADGYGYVTNTNDCESVLFSLGGSGDGFDKDSLIQDCSSVSIYSSTEGDGFDFDALSEECHSVLFTIGGSGNGFDTDSLLQDCSLVSIYANTGDDGFDYVEDIPECNLVFFSCGGTGNGFDADSVIQDCDLPNLFSGGESDGYSYVYEIPCLDDSVVIEAEVINQITCPLSDDDGSAYVSIVDGFPDWRSVADYTYIWKNSNGDTLTGYPKTTSETSDTIYNLGVDDYTIIVKDANGYTDSTEIYITDCLYRGGEGSGFYSKDTISECYLTSIYANSGNDGFDFKVDTQTCYNNLFSVGGDGFGFDDDTLYQDCSAISIYKSSGNDGFDYLVDTVDCSDTYFYAFGGNGNGFDNDTFSVDCSVPNISTGGQADGADQQYNGCTPFIYENTATNNTCLTADTITSDGSNEWLLIYKDEMVVAAIKDYGNKLGEITTEFYINEDEVRVDPYGILPSYYLDRNFNISAENLIYDSHVRVRLYFLTNELQALIDADDDVTSINYIGATRYHGDNEDCTLSNNIDNNDSTNYVHYSDYTWDTYENGYYIEFDINAFSEFYINNSSSLPEEYSLSDDISVISDYNGSDVSCYGDSNGVAVVTPRYGVEPYTYQWDDPLSQTDSIADSLAAGTYHVTIIDANDVAHIDSITVSNPDTLSVNATVTEACFDEDNGTIDLSVSGGTLAEGSLYSYSWSTFDGSGLVVSDSDQYALIKGTYYVTVMDDNLCKKDTTVIVAEYDTSEAPSSIKVINDSTCEGTSKLLVPVNGVLGNNAEWVWYNDAACLYKIYTGDTCEVDPDLSSNFYVRAEGGCDTSSTTAVYVNVLLPSEAADSISLSDKYIVSGTNDTLVVCGGTLGAGASWEWYLDAACSISAGDSGDTLFVAPTETTEYWVRAEGSCNITDTVSVAVYVIVEPLKPGTPTGADTLCQNAPNTNYSTTGATNATSYNWNIYPDSAGTITGTGTTIEVDWSASYYEEVGITVKGVNSSGTGPVSDTLWIWIWKRPQAGGAHHISNKWGE